MPAALESEMTRTPILADSSRDHQARLGRLLHAGLRIIGRLPLPVLASIGAVFGRIAFSAGARGALTARMNVGYCFPELDDTQRRALAEASFVAAGRLAGEMTWLARHANADAWIARVHGAHLIEELGSSGCLALVPHFGNWELLHVWIARRQALNVMYRPPRQRWLRAMLDEARRVRSSRMIPATRGGVRAALTALRNGEVVAILPDQVPARGGVLVPFFGHPSRTMTLAARLAIETGVPVAMAWAERRADGRFEVHITRLEADRRGVAAFMRDVNAAIEDVVHRAPAQYPWSYKRFKHQRPGGFRYYR